MHIHGRQCPACPPWLKKLKHQPLSHLHPKNSTVRKSPPFVLHNKPAATTIRVTLVFYHSFSNTIFVNSLNTPPAKALPERPVIRNHADSHIHLFLLHHSCGIRNWYASCNLRSPEETSRRRMHRDVSILGKLL
jgi:hypothetical protein